MPRRLADPKAAAAHTWPSVLLVYCTRIRLLPACHDHEVNTTYYVRHLSERSRTTFLLIALLAASLNLALNLLSHSISALISSSPPFISHVQFVDLPY